MKTLPSVLRTYVRNQISIFFFTVLILVPTVNASAASGVISLGDSLTAGLTNDGRGERTCLALNGASIAVDEQRTCKGGGRRNRGGWQPILSTLTNQDVYNFGNTSETTAEILARSAQNISAQPGNTVLILAGTNDVIRDVPLPEIVQNLTSIINIAISAGRRPIIGTIPPLLGSRFANRNANVLALNEEIRNFADVEVADHYAALVDGWPVHNSGDFIHFGPTGNSTTAAVWAQAIIATPEEPEQPSIIILVPIINLLLEGSNQEGETATGENGQ